MCVVAHVRVLPRVIAHVRVLPRVIATKPQSLTLRIGRMLQEGRSKKGTLWGNQSAIDGADLLLMMVVRSFEECKRLERKRSEE